MMAEMSVEAKKSLAEFNAAQMDWFTVCPKCQVKLSGTLAELMAHKCQGAKDVT